VTRAAARGGVQAIREAADAAGAGRSAIRSLLELVGELHADPCPHRLAARVIERVGDPELDEAQRADLHALEESAARFETLGTLLGELALSDGGEATSAEGVTLSTVHQAKGLEWNIVFLIGLCEGRFPAHLPPRAREEAEERRLFHVGITRARDQLYLSYPEDDVPRGPRPATRPSRFLAELAPALYERWRIVSTKE
jgi:DNA helicase-2/ATP-dependent DNA helicase PcrA